MAKPIGAQLISTAKAVKLKLRSAIDTDATSIPFELMGHIGKDGKTLKELAELMHCSKQEASRQVKRAEANNWVCLTENPEDGRSKKVTYSDYGKSMLLEGVNLHSNIEKEIRKKMGDKKVNQLISLLDEVENCLKD